MEDAIIASAVRSPVGRGKSDGALANVSPIDLSAPVSYTHLTLPTICSV